MRELGIDTRFEKDCQISYFKLPQNCQALALILRKTYQDLKQGVCLFLCTSIQTLNFLLSPLNLPSFQSVSSSVLAQNLFCVHLFLLNLLNNTIQRNNFFWTFGGNGSIANSRYQISETNFSLCIILELHHHILTVFKMWGGGCFFILTGAILILCNYLTGVILTLLKKNQQLSPMLLASTGIFFKKKILLNSHSHKALWKCSYMKIDNCYPTARSHRRFPLFPHQDEWELN